MSLVRRGVQEAWAGERPDVRAAVHDVIAAAAAGHPAPARARLRPGFITAVRLYAAALRHPAASEDLCASLFTIAVGCVAFVRRAA